MNAPREECNHNYQHLDTTKYTTDAGYNTTFVRVDRYYCTKCLDQKQLKREATTRETPEWYR